MKLNLPFSCHVVKRTSLEWYKAWAIRLGSIVLACLFCAVISGLLTDISAVEMYKTIFSGAFSTPRRTWVTLQNTAVLLCIALALTPAFKMRFWNIGGEGQVLMGALGATACMVVFNGKLPNGLTMILMVLVSVLFGAVWAAIPAILKAKWRTNETLSTLMMNYIGTQIVAYFVIKWENPKGSGQVGIVNQDSHFGWLPEIGNKYLLTIIVVALLTVFMYFYLNYTKHGYEIAVVGESERTARYVGIKVNRIIVRTLILSGAICGVCGLLLSGSINHTISTSLAAGRGFTAVMVSWMSKFNPFIMFLASLLLVTMERGSSEIATMFKLNESFGEILSGIILFFIIGCEFFISYKLVFAKKENKEEK